MMPRLGPRSLLLVDGALVAALVLLLASWFAAWPPGLPPAVPLVAVVATVVLRAAGGSAGERRLGVGKLLKRLRPAPETAACLAIAVLYRMPALLHPWGFVNRDGAYGATIAIHLLEGVRPAPIF